MHNVESKWDNNQFSLDSHEFFILIHPLEKPRQV